MFQKKTQCFYVYLVKVSQTHFLQSIVIILDILIRRTSTSVSSEAIANRQTDKNHEIDYHCREIFTKKILRHLSLIGGDWRENKVSLNPFQTDGY